jgi:hypothetical protein
MFMDREGFDFKPSFGRHEKFVFRYGWLKKGFDALSDDPYIFSRDEALVVLGVGKNMVRSIRHWCLATKVARESNGGGRTRELDRTRLGERLLADGGWDPYLEDVGTLWLIHWELVTNTERALVWNIAYSGFYESEFTKPQLNGFVARQIDRLGFSTTDSMIAREVDTFLRTYTTAITRTKVGHVAEESLDCPLAELDIIRAAPEDGIYRFDVGPKVTLPTAIVGYALLFYFCGLELPHRTVAVDDCIYRWGSPGQVYKLDENSMVEYLDELERLTDGALRLQESGGLHQVYLHGLQAHEFEHYALDLLDGYYGRHGV